VGPRCVDVDLGRHLVDADLEQRGVDQDRRVWRHGPGVVHGAVARGVDVVALDVLLERLGADLVGQRQDVVLGRADERAARLDDRPVLEPVVQQSAADPVAGLDDEDRAALLSDVSRRDEAGEAAADHDHVDLLGEGAMLRRAKRGRHGRESGRGARAGKQPAAGEGCLQGRLKHREPNLNIAYIHLSVMCGGHPVNRIGTDRPGETVTFRHGRTRSRRTNLAL
jgi:hypothetical protein